jgi:4-aminobutyrate aminotransferase-like enzyme
VNQLAMVSDASTFLKVELGHIQRDKSLITDIRGNGTFIGFDVESSETAESVRSWL